MKVCLQTLLFILASGCLFFASGQSGKVRSRQVETIPVPPSSAATPNAAQNEAQQPRTNGTTTVPPSNGQITQQSAAAQTTGEEVLTVDTTLVTIPVAVTDQNGKIIVDLRQADFRVFENGVEQQIAYFANTEQPFTVVLLLDVSNSTELRIEQIQDAAIAFVRQLREADRVMVVSFDEEYRVLSEPTNNRDTLVSAIRRARFGGGTSLYDAIDFVFKMRLPGIRERKAIILFTDGVDTTSRRVGRARNLADAMKVNAVIYPIYYDTFTDVNSRSDVYDNVEDDEIYDIDGDVFGRSKPKPPKPQGDRGAGTTSTEYRSAEIFLENLANATGGKIYRAAGLRNLEAAFRNIAEELRRQYSLGYYPPDTGAAGQRKQITVRSTRPELVVRARDSYIVGREN